MKYKKRPKFYEGERVVVNKYSEYRNKYAFNTGVVEQVFLKSKDKFIYGVRLDNHTNPSSAKGLFWFEAISLNFENNNINNESEETLMFDNYVVAMVEFLDNPNADKIAYALYTPSNIIAGDTVVVSTGHHGLSVARVAEILVKPEDKKRVKHNREIVCKVDLTEFNARKENAKRLAELKSSMEERIQKQKELALYEALAEKDPVLKEMLDEYKTITGNYNV